MTLAGLGFCLEFFPCLLAGHMVGYRETSALAVNVCWRWWTLVITTMTVDGWPVWVSQLKCVSVLCPYLC